jgi:hypothetical protein
MRVVFVPYLLEIRFLQGLDDSGLIGSRGLRVTEFGRLGESFCQILSVEAKLHS